MPCHPRATCHIAGCCHLANSLIWSQSHVPHCRVNKFHPPYWKSFFAVFCVFIFQNAVWASTSGGFRIVFDNFVLALNKLFRWNDGQTDRCHINTARQFVNKLYTRVVRRIWSSPLCFCTVRGCRKSAKIYMAACCHTVWYRKRHRRVTDGRTDRRTDILRRHSFSGTLVRYVRLMAWAVPSVVSLWRCYTPGRDLNFSAIFLHRLIAIRDSDIVYINILSKKR